MINNVPRCLNNKIMELHRGKQKKITISETAVQDFNTNRNPKQPQVAAGLWQGHTKRRDHETGSK